MGLLGRESKKRNLRTQEKRNAQRKQDGQNGDKVKSYNAKCRLI